MTVRQYTGARYVPVFADPIDWDSTKTYEPLTIVYYQGNSFTSRQAVPAGIDITNSTYWAQTGNYNAQIEQYRTEVQTFDGRITKNSDDIDAIETVLPISEFDSTNTVDARFDAIESDITTISSNSWVTTNRIADNAVSFAKINQSAKNLLTRPKIGVIGDSFSNASNEWPAIVGSANGKTVVNVATSATGFTIGTPNFNTQLENLINNNDMSEFSHIIVYGGVNDWRVQHSTVSQMTSAFETFLNTFNTITGVKPKLIFAFCNVGYTSQSEYNGFSTWYYGCLDSLRNMNMPGVVEYVPYWLQGLASVFESDNLHPNAKGEKYIAGFMEQLINGTYTGVTRKIAININLSNTNASLHGTTSEVYAILHNNTISTAGHLELTVNGSTNVSAFGALANRVGFGDLSSDVGSAEWKLVDVHVNGTTPVNSILNTFIGFNINTGNCFYLHNIGTYASSYTILYATLDFSKTF